MKTRYIILLLFGWFSLPNDLLAQKDHLTITIENLPVNYTWSRDTVDSQGKSTGSSNGSENVSLTISPDISENYSSFTRSGDTTFFTSTNSRTTIVYDNETRSIRKIDYIYNYATGSTVTFGQELRATNISVTDADTVFTVELTGDNVLGHELYYSSDFRIGPIDGPGEYSDDNYISLGTSGPETHIRISVSKQHLLGVQNEHSLTSSLTIFPNPASSIVNAYQLETAYTSRLTITDMLGRTMGTYSANPTNDILQMDVSSIPPGIYWLRAGGEMRKFVIAR